MKDLAMLLHEAAGLMRRRFEQAARPFGLTLMQWRALGLLGKNGPMRQVAIGEALEASPMTISDLAERLSSAGLVTRRPDPTDSRAKQLDLTEEGRQMIARMATRADEIFAESFSGITGPERDAMMSALEKMKTNLGAATAAPADGQQA